MDDVERMYRHLVHIIRTSYPAVPHAAVRGRRAVSDDPSLSPASPRARPRDQPGLRADPAGAARRARAATSWWTTRCATRLAAELAAPMPDPSMVREFASSHVALAPEWLHLLDAQTRASGAQGAWRGHAPRRRARPPLRLHAAAAPSPDRPHVRPRQRRPPPAEAEPAPRREADHRRGRRALHLLQRRAPRRTRRSASVRTAART